MVQNHKQADQVVSLPISLDLRIWEALPALDHSRAHVKLRLEGCPGTVYWLKTCIDTTSRPDYRLSPKSAPHEWVSSCNTVAYDAPRLRPRAQ